LNDMIIREQLEILGSHPVSFSGYIGKHVNHDGSLRPLTCATFQINVGYRCNQVCRHCHVNASPERTEMMNRKTIDDCLNVISQIDNIKTVDITGGAPEMNENFRYLVEESHKLNKHVIDRCNLTILEYPGYEYLYEFLASHDVEIIASLPHFSASFTNRQRGNNVFEISITALKKLNELGYGKDKILNLVYNPIGTYLSAPQKQLEREFKENLKRKYNVVFNNLYCINNLPINRYLVQLHKTEKFTPYMELLVNSFNPATLDGLMCRHQISVGYDGKVYDCDFNQMLDLAVPAINNIRNFRYNYFIKRKIEIANHCFGCTAGSGSSCGGEINTA
jgi:radical SAM/Cys-rich protein